MSNKAKSIIYAFAIAAGMANAFINWNGGNTEAAIAWFCAGGIAAGAFSAYSELRRKEKE